MKNKHNTIKWLNIFLLVINLSAFATFLFMNREQNTEVEEQYSSDEFLKTRLKLTDAQYEKVLDMDQEVFRNYQLLIDIECEANFDLVKEISSTNPSKEEIKRLLDKVGRYHMLIKRQTVRHFENIKSICNDEQKDLLHQLLLEMMEIGNNCQYCNKVNCSRRNEINNKKN